MSSKRKQRRRTCESKVRHSDGSSANREAGRLTREFARKYHAYKCKFCGGYHVGRPKRNLNGKSGFQFWETFK